MKNLRQNGKNLHSKVEKSHLNDVRVFRPKKKFQRKENYIKGVFLLQGNLELIYFKS